MTKNFYPIRYFQIAIVVLLLTLMAFFTTTSSASTKIDATATPESKISLKRHDIIDVAEAYKNYLWRATADNILHESDVNTPDYEWCAQHRSPLSLVFGCWKNPTTEHPTQENYGIPYSWFGTTAIKANQDNPNELHLKPMDSYTKGDTYYYFDDKINAGAPAGNVFPLKNENIAFANRVGVDCVGLVTQAWRMGTRIGMSALSSQSRGIRFKDLQMGDELIRFNMIYPDPKKKGGPTPEPYEDPKDHVMIFLTFENSNFNPDNPTDAIFYAYEAASGPAKVVVSRYKVKSYHSTPPKGDDHLRENVDKVELERLSYCDHDACHDDGGYIQDGFYPRSYFKPLDMVLVLDRSGSIGTHLPAVQQTAQLIVDTLRDGDKISIVSFDDSATITSPIQSINSTIINQKETIKQVIRDLQPSTASSTSVRAGLDAGFRQLTTPPSAGQPSTNDPTGDTARVMILVSDGLEGEETPPLVGDDNYAFLDMINSQNIHVYPVVVTGDQSSNEALMQTIATKTEGEYIAGPFGSYGLAWELYTGILMKITGREVVKSDSDDFPTSSTESAPTQASQSSERDLLMDSGMGDVTISFFKLGNNLNLILKNPDGDIVGANSPDVTFTPGSFVDSYTIYAPTPGHWKLDVSGDTGAKYSITASSEFAPLTIFFATDEKKYKVGDPIEFTATLEDSISDSPTSPEYIHQASINVTVENPAHTTSTVTLYDDGTNGDDASNDGIYRGIFSNTSLPGSYTLTALASGNTNRDGLPFIREAHSTVYFEETPHVVSIVRSSPNPSSATTVRYKVTFSKPVLNVDNKDFVLTTSGLTGAQIGEIMWICQGYDPDCYDSEGGQPETTYDVTVNTGSGTGTLRLDMVNNGTITTATGDQLDNTGFNNGVYISGETYSIENIAKEITVTKLNDTNDGDCSEADCSLREAIASATPGSTIRFASSLSGGTIYLASGLTLDMNLTIDGSSLAIPVTINGEAENSVIAFTVNAPYIVTLKNLKITKSYIGIDNTGSLTLTDSIITESIENAIRSRKKPFTSNSGILTIEHSTISNNGAPTNSDSAISNQGTLTITDSIFSGNGAYISGGAIANGGELQITNSSFSNNSTRSFYSAGGGAIINTGNLRVENTTFSNNTVDGSQSTGGAILNHVNGRANIINSTFTGNHADQGFGEGGSIQNRDHATLTITGSTFSNNTAVYGTGGAINNSSNAIFTITNSTFSGNIAHWGGALHNQSSVSSTIANSTFSGNTASFGGGAIANGNYHMGGTSGKLIITNSTLSGNGDPTSPGSGVDNLDEQTITIKNSTFSSSSVRNAGTLNYSNTILADSASNMDCVNTGVIGININNLVESSNTCSAALNGDPNLGPLAGNGGLTQTMALQTGSSAIDAGDAATCSADPINNLDQRGIARPVGTQCDIGAYERVVAISPTLTPTITPTYAPVNPVDLVSVDSSEMVGNNTSQSPSVSADGRYVVFSSTASNLISNDTNGVEDVFVRDLQLGTTERISVGVSGTESNGISSLPTISPDSRYIGFVSYATNLVDNDTNDKSDAFLYDRQTGQMIRMSVNSSNQEQGNSWTNRPSVSPDGNYWVFMSQSNNLTPDDTTDTGDIFMYNQSLGTLEFVSPPNGGQGQGDGISTTAVVSNGGRYVVYQSAATNLVANDTNGAVDIFRYDTQTKAVVRISVDSAGQQTNGDSERAAVSADGRYIVFRSSASNLVTGDCNGSPDIFLRDTVLGTTTRISVGDNGQAANGVSSYPAISTDGRYVEFSSTASNLVAGDTNGVADIFVRDLQTGKIRLVSVDSNGVQGNGISDGRASFAVNYPYLVFASSASNLVVGDGNGVADIFAVDFGTVLNQTYATSTPEPTSAASCTPTSTFTPTPTPTVTTTATETATVTPTITVTQTPIVTATPTKTVTSTKTATPTVTRTITPTPTATQFTAVKSWTFNTTTESWVDGAIDTTGFGWQAGGYIGATITGGNAQLFSPTNINLANIQNNRILKIRFKNGTSATNGYIYFSTNDPTCGGYACTGHIVAFSPTANSNYTEYTLTMPATTWTGTLLRIRIDMPGTSGSFSVDYVKIGDY